jgi:TetR/AcrR family transcriptional repressor of nem operon
MARYGPEHKEATRLRMIETSGRRLKQDGIDGSGIATLVADAGLTNGAFYGHFSSKDDLIATVVADQLSRQLTVLESFPPGWAPLEAFVRDYLSPTHRDNPGEGCPSAALLDEVGRCNPVVRDAYTAGIGRILDLVARRLDHFPRPVARERAIGLLTLLFSTLQLARAVQDRKLSNQILSAGVANAIALAAPSASGATA